MENQFIEQKLEELSNRNVQLWTEGGKLKYKAAAGMLTPDDMSFLKANKIMILEYLENDQVKVVVDEENKYEPFALTEIQQAYMLGRNKAFEYGGVACHIYLELEYDQLDAERVEKVWNQLIARHPMLRARMSVNGYQQVMSEPVHFDVECIDLREQTREVQEQKRCQVKAQLDHKVYNPEEWPLYTMVVSRGTDCDILHLSIEFLVADWLSIWTILSEFEKMYFAPEEKLPELELTFRDYQLAEQKMRRGSKFIQDKEYWMKRIANLPKAPELPVLSSVDQTEARFERHQFWIEKEKWERFQQLAREHSVTPTAAVMTAYGLCLARWSQNKALCLNLSILNRFDLHPQVQDIVGDFTTSSLLAIEQQNGLSFAEMAKRTNGQLFEDLDHRLFNGVMVLRELQKIHGNVGAQMPYVFTGAIGLISKEQSELRGRMTERGISQTPQVFLDCQAMDTEDGLNINLDSRVGIFPKGFMEDFTDTFRNLLQKLSDSAQYWNLRPMQIALPEWQQEERRVANDTHVKQSVHFIQEPVLAQAMANPGRLIVADVQQEWNGAELLTEVTHIQAALIELGIGKGDIVAVALPKSRWQMAACLGILETGAAYVPLDIKQAKGRNEIILTKTAAKAVLCISDMPFGTNQNIQEIYIDKLEDVKKSIVVKEKAQPEDIAYIIFTSGSTGEPKGVAMSHAAAVNTIEAINRVFDVSEKDRVFQLSQLNFDLSVYDLFGVPAMGGAVIIPDQEQYRNPAHWSEMMNKYGVTLWNSVPALMQMLLIYQQYNKGVQDIPLRLALLSGDWIPLEQPEQLMELFPEIRVISLGGATEGGIWSIFHECCKGEKEHTEFRSIPYGKPLANQGYLVLDSNGEECPVWVPGELYITGDSLADSYWKAQELTERAFVIVNGQRRYRTGDMGCYHPGGEIEFLGRVDGQVKLRGHRIELGEIETVYKKYLPVQSVCCLLYENGEENMIAAVYVPAEGEACEVMEQPERILQEWLPKYMIPSIHIAVEKIPLTNNGKVDVRAVKRIVESTIEDKKKNRSKEGTITELEQKINRIFAEALRQENLGVEDDFYEAGANSLVLARIAGQLNREIEKEIPFDEFLVQILNESNVRALANFVERKRKNIQCSEKMQVQDGEENKSFRWRRNEGACGLCVVFETYLPACLMQESRMWKEWNCLYVSEHMDVVELVREIMKEDAKYCTLLSTDYEMVSCLKTASSLMEQECIPRAVVVVECEYETELEPEESYMGDLDYVLTLSEKADEAEITEALQEICYGDIRLHDGTDEEALLAVVNGHMDLDEEE